VLVVMCLIYVQDLKIKALTVRLDELLSSLNFVKIGSISPTHFLDKSGKNFHLTEISLDFLRVSAQFHFILYVIYF